MYSSFSNKHLITTQDWTVEEIEKCLNTAKRLKENRQLNIPHDHILRSKTFFMLFFEESTRTRNSFEAGITQLGGHAIFLTPRATQIDHGETAKDTIKVLTRYGDGIGIRKTYGEGNRYMREVARYSEIPVINMQCEDYHPTQALADLLTIKEKFGDNLRGKKFVISWTYAPNYIRPLSMPQSLILLMPRFGMDVTLAHPEEFSLKPEIVEQAKANAREAGVKFNIVSNMEEAFEDAHIVYAKSWGPIMHTKDKKEGLALIEKYPDWMVDKRKMEIALKEAIYMHCMPADRDIEVTSEVLDGPQSVIYDEAENRLHINKALMALTMAHI
ncbi:MAG: ornithine carbamoyltransferase [Spirochaetes bacterium]|nr:MAG: ornithine carbamoyltransferase [Spirochaetota bacterium]